MKALGVGLGAFAFADVEVQTGTERRAPPGPDRPQPPSWLRAPRADVAAVPDAHLEQRRGRGAGAARDPRPYAA